MAERGIDISHETIRFWWNRFGLMFARQRSERISGASGLRRFPQWRWHFDEVFVKITGKLRYLWRAVDHEGEVLETQWSRRSGTEAAALKFLKRIMKKIWPTTERQRHRRPLLLSRSDERDRQRQAIVTKLPAVRPPTIGRRIFAPAISTTRTSHAALSGVRRHYKSSVQFTRRSTIISTRSAIS